MHRQTIYKVEAGQQEGLWQWSCYWTGTDTRGTASTLGEGLEAIKSRVTDEALQNLPGRVFYFGACGVA